MYCKNCGKELKENSRFCSNCGTEISQQSYQYENTEDTLLLDENQDNNDSLNNTVYLNNVLDVQNVQPKKSRKSKKLFIIFSAVFLVIAAVVLVLFFMHRDTQKRYNEQITLGDKYLSEMDYDNAEIAYLEAIQIDEKHAKPYTQLADIYIEKDQYEKAEEILQKGSEKVTGKREKETIQNKQKEVSKIVEQKRKEEEQKKREAEIKSRYEWKVDPTFEAEDINYVQIGQSATLWKNELSQQAMWDIAVAKSGNSYALVNMEGELLTEYAYKSVIMWNRDFHNSDHNYYLLERVSSQYEPFWGTDWTRYSYQKDSGLSPMDGTGGPITKNGEIIYQENTQSIVLQDALNQKEKYPDHPVGARVYKTDNSWDHYVIVNNRKVINNETYDAVGAYSCGVIPVSKNGKWGYLDEDGNEIISIEYDASWTGYYQDTSNSESDTLAFCYAASENTIVLQKNNQWSLVDITGKEIIPEGEFEAIRPVYNGQCWVKKNGKWGVIQLTDKVLAQDVFSNSLCEQKLVSITETTANHTMENHAYVDMDHDGNKELIGAYANNMGIYQTWYCSSDGKKCSMINQDSDGMDGCLLEVLEMEKETHVVANTYRTMGTGKNFSIFRLKNQEIQCLISNNYGYVSMSDEGDILLDVEAYDMAYTPGTIGLIGHTWKDTYLFFDGDTYKEYGATEITEEEFLNYQNAAELKSQIDSNLRQTTTSSIEFKYFRRKNGIIHIQCNVNDVSGIIQFQYYTVRYENNVLSKNLGTPNSGQMHFKFTDLEPVD